MVLLITACCNKLVKVVPISCYIGHFFSRACDCLMHVSMSEYSNVGEEPIVYSTLYINRNNFDYLTVHNFHYLWFSAYLAN